MLANMGMASVDESKCHTWNLRLTEVLARIHLRSWEFSTLLDWSDFPNDLWVGWWLHCGNKYLRHRIYRTLLSCRRNQTLQSLGHLPWTSICLDNFEPSGPPSGTWSSESASSHRPLPQRTFFWRCSPGWICSSSPEMIFLPSCLSTTQQGSRPSPAPRRSHQKGSPRGAIVSTADRLCHPNRLHWTFWTGQPSLVSVAMSLLCTLGSTGNPATPLWCERPWAAPLPV